MSATTSRLGAARDERRRGRQVLRIVLLLTAGFMVVEFVGGLVTNSLALLSDAGHMLTDVAALSLSLLAIWFATKPPTARKSFGYHRTEILAALINGVAIVVIAVLIVLEAVERLVTRPEVQSGPMLVVATVGLVVNVVGVVLLHRGRGHSLNIQGAFLHVLGDLLGSIGAIAAAIVMLTTGFYLADPLISFLIAGLIIFSAVRLISRSVDILLEGTPAHLDLAEIREALLDVPGVQEIHDLHVWTITSGFDSLTAHLVLSPGARHQDVLKASHEMLVEKFGLDHSTLQPEEGALLPCGDPARASAAEDEPAA
ncbi:MAG: cation diffusion facilitator family transporter [Planctomycetota bacterium]